MFSIFLDFGSVFLEAVVSVWVCFVLFLFFSPSITCKITYSCTLGQKMASVSTIPSLRPMNSGYGKAVLHFRGKKKPSPSSLGFLMFKVSTQWMIFIYQFFEEHKHLFSPWGNHLRAN